MQSILTPEQEQRLKEIHSLLHPLSLQLNTVTTQLNALVMETAAILNAPYVQARQMMSNPVTIPSVSTPREQVVEDF